MIPKQKLISLLKVIRKDLEVYGITQELQVPTSLSLQELNAVFVNLSLKKQYDLIDSVVILERNDKVLPIVFICRNMFETYLQTALLTKVNSLEAYKSYFLYRDFAYLKALQEEAKIVNGKQKEKIETIIKRFENTGTEKEYKELVGSFKRQLENEFPEHIKDFQKIDNNPIAWANLRFYQIPKLIGGDVPMLYRRHYWELSLYSHPTAEAIYQQDSLLKKKTLIVDSLILTIHLTIWIIKILKSDDKEICDKMSLHMSTLVKIVE